MCVGETIYRLRRERNLSQGDLADRLNVSRQSVSRWETGGAVPELDKLIRMSHLFGVTLDELVSGEEPGAIPVSPSACAPPKGVTATGDPLRHRRIKGRYPVQGRTKPVYNLHNSGGRLTPWDSIGIWAFAEAALSVWTLVQDTT